MELSFLKSWSLMKEAPFPMAMTSNIISNRVNASPTWRLCQIWLRISTVWQVASDPNHVYCDDHFNFFGPTCSFVLKLSINHNKPPIGTAYTSHFWNMCDVFFVEFPTFWAKIPIPTWVIASLVPVSPMTRPATSSRAEKSMSKDVQRRGGVWWIGKLYYPLVNRQKAIEHGHRNSGFTH